MIWGMMGPARDLSRLHEITSVLIRHGLGDLVRRAGVGNLLETAGQMLEVRPDERSIEGTVTIKARVVKPLEWLVLDLDRRLTATAAVEKGQDHDNDPVQVKMPYTGVVLNAGFYSRLREINEDSSFSVNG